MGTTFDSPCVLILGLPERAFCGIDLLSFTSSPKFQGIKQLPAGWHFVFVSATNSFSLRHGAWFSVREAQDPRAPELFVLRWNDDLEELVPETSSLDVLRYRSNVGSLWRENLTPYRQSTGQTSTDNSNAIEEKQDWPQLTDCITLTLLSRITSTASTSASYWIFTSASSALQDVDDIPGISNAERAAHTEKELVFLPINLKQTWRAGAVGRERTQAAQDRSWALGQLISDHCSEPRDLIGELQVCFLLVLTLNNNSSLEQWKRLLGLVLTCRDAAGKQPSFFCEVLGVLRLQMEHCGDVEGGLFDMGDEDGGLLKIWLRRFRVGLECLDREDVGAVLEELGELEGFLKEEFGWVEEIGARKGMLDLEDGESAYIDMEDADEEDETGDYAPAVVELTEEQMTSLGWENNTVAPMTKGVTKDHILPSRTRQAASNGAIPHEQASDHYEEDDRDIEELDARY